MDQLLASEICDIDRHVALIKKLVRQVCARNGVPPDDQNDLLGDVLLKMVKNDYALLRAFRGGGQLAIFLRTVIYRVMLDRRTAAWGKWRASQKARRLGGAAVQLERLLMRDRLTAPEAIRALAHDPKWRVTSETARRILAALPSKRRPVEVPIDSGLALPAAAAEDPLVAAGLEDAAERIKQALLVALRSLSAGDRDLLLRRFRRGMPVSVVAKELGLDQKTLYRQYERILRQLRRDLETAGVTIDEIRPLFGGGLLDSVLSSQNAAPGSLVSATHAAANARLSTLSQPV